MCVEMICFVILKTNANIMIPMMAPIKNVPQIQLDFVRMDLSVLVWVSVLWFMIWRWEEGEGEVGEGKRVCERITVHWVMVVWKWKRRREEEWEREREEERKEKGKKERIKDEMYFTQRECVYIIGTTYDENVTVSGVCTEFYNSFCSLSITSYLSCLSSHNCPFDPYTIGMFSLSLSLSIHTCVSVYLYIYRWYSCVCICVYVYVYVKEYIWVK